MFAAARSRRAWRGRGRVWSEEPGKRQKAKSVSHLPDRRARGYREHAVRPAPPRAATRRALRRPPERAGTHRRHAVAFVVRALRLALLFGLASEPRGVSLERPARQEVPRVHKLRTVSGRSRGRPGCDPRERSAECCRRPCRVVKAGARGGCGQKPKGRVLRRHPLTRQLVVMR